MSYALILQHVPWEGPGLIGEVLTELGVPMRHAMVVDEPEPTVPDLAELAALVVMGGPMAADDDVRHPGLAAERDLLARAAGAGLPVIGICLGAQLLATALGARLIRGAVREVGFGPVEIVADDPVLAPFGSVGALPRVLHWHDDIVDLPPGGTLLASSDATPCQAFRFGAHAYGFQFHPEATMDLLDDWLQTPAMLADLTADAIDPEDLRWAGAGTLPGMNVAARAAFGHWATIVRGLAS